MALICAFTVYGEAVPQGSMNSFARVDRRTGQVQTHITHAKRAALLQWRADIRAALQLEAPRFPIALVRGPVAVRVVFHVAKPPSVSKRRLFPTVAPDLDKLCRAAGDSLESVLVGNDAQIVHWDVWKVYTEGPAHATFEVWQPDAVIAMPTENPFEQPGLFES